MSRAYLSIYLCCLLPKHMHGGVWLLITQKPVNRPRWWKEVCFIWGANNCSGGGWQTFVQRPTAPPSTSRWSEMKIIQSGLTLSDPMDYIVHGIIQARILEWVAIPFSKGSSQQRDWTEPRSFTLQVDSLPSPALQADSLPAELSGKPSTNKGWELL